jgi:hypothetical protein
MNPLFAGLQSAGQSIAGGIQQRQKNKEVRSRYSQILTGMGHDPDELAGLSIADLGGMVESGAMQFADQKQQAELQRLQQENEAFRRAMEMQQRGQQAEERMQTQIRQAGQGIGSGVLRPEFQENLAMARNNPAAAMAADMGIPLEAAQRYFGQAEGMNPYEQARTRKTLAEAEALEQGLAAPRDGFSADEIGQPRPIPGLDGKFFVPTSTGGGQILDSNEIKQREHNVEQLIRLRDEAEQSGNAKNAAIYGDIIEKTRQGQQYSAMDIAILQAMGFDVNAFLGLTTPVEAAAETAAPPPPDPQAARRNVFDRLGF